MRAGPPRLVRAHVVGRDGDGGRVVVAAVVVTSAVASAVVAADAEQVSTVAEGGAVGVVGVATRGWRDEAVPSDGFNRLVQSRLLLLRMRRRELG